MSAAFVKELLRRATLLSAVASRAPTVTAEHLRDALDELRETQVRAFR